MERWPRQRRLRSSVTWKVKSRVPSHPQHLLTHAYSGWKLPAASILPPNLPATFGRLAATILIQATALSSKRVDIIFDTYEMPSIKRMERERRGMCDRNYKNIGPQQIRPADFNEALKSPSFKTELPSFLLNEWKEQAYAHIIHERHVYVGHLGECLHFFVEDAVRRSEA